MRTSSMLLGLLLTVTGATVADAQLAPAWMVPVSANTPGEYGTYWLTDLAIHNPQGFTLPVAIQLLPSDRENWSVPTVVVDVPSWGTANLWDVLSPDVLDHVGTAALLVWTDLDPADCPSDSCDLLVTSRTFTPDPLSADGEFGQTVPAAAAADGLDWVTLGYLAGVLNDGGAFRCNVGVASWTAGWTTVRLDVQDADGFVLATEELRIPPFGHVQRRLATAVEGGSLVFYLVDGPDDALVFPYASVVNRATGDASYLSARWSQVGLEAGATVQRARPAPPRPAAEGGKRSIARAPGARPEAAGRNSLQ